ncbi:MAG: trypsin-like peptidase domain-containing protein [Planctomycetota bacterium]
MAGSLFGIDLSRSSLRHSLKWLAAAWLWLYIISGGLNALAVAQSSPDVRLYFFTMSACPPCAQAAPIVDQFLTAGYPIQKIDARLQPQWTQQYQVSSTPTYVMTIGGREVGRYGGVLNSEQLQNWFQRSVQAAQASAEPLAAQQPVSIPTTQPDRGAALAEPGASSAASISALAGAEAIGDTMQLADTMHVGTRQPANEAESRAMAATVRIQVEDAEGISTATGTVIHSHAGESLVMTCGHVFREAQGRGVITADVNWLGDQPRRVPGELINYDAGPLDVALVLIRPGFEIPAVPLAPRNQVIEREQPIFSIGCDRNAPPTIRRSRIKDVAEYDGARKYDIYGRPVLGRSGGGLFRPDGTLIGVCNAAAVEVDEGIYSAIDNLYMPLDKANLAHLFQPGLANSYVSTAPNAPPSKVQGSPPAASDNLVPLNRPGQLPIPAVTGGFNTVQQELPPSSAVVGEWEAIVILRRRGNSAAAQTVVINQPSDEFLNYVRGSWSSRPNPNAAPSEPATAQQIARMREEMPQPPLPSEPLREARAQSPR